MIDAVIALVVELLTDATHLSATAEVTRRSRAYAAADAGYACPQQLDCEGHGMHLRYSYGPGTPTCTEDDGLWTCRVECSVECQIERPDTEADE